MMSWFLYINAVMIAFILPLAWLRFFWWRLNIWGEAAGVLLGLPLGYLIWFPLGFSERPFWQAFFVLFAAGWITILLVTWLTPAERIETLRTFYARCRPTGLWGAVTDGIPHADLETASRQLRRDLASCVLGIVVCGSMVLALNFAVAGWSLAALLAIVVMTVAGLAFIRRWRSTAAGEALRTAGVTAV